MNGVEVVKISTLADGTRLFDLADLLFDHRERISELATQMNVHSSQRNLPGKCFICVKKKLCFVTYLLVT